MEKNVSAKPRTYTTPNNKPTLLNNKQQKILEEQIKQSKQLLPTLTINIIAILALIYIQPNPLLLITILTITGAIITKTTHPGELLKQFTINAAFIILYIIINNITGGHGIIGLTISVIIITSIIIARRWKQYITAKETIETFIWGEPLLNKNRTKKLNTQKQKK